MKTFLKNNIYNCIYFISKLYRLVNYKNNNASLVLVPSWEGSIGDEAVIDSITNQLKKQAKQVTLIHFAKNKEWSFIDTIDTWYSVDGLYKPKGWKLHLKLMKLLAKHNEFYTLGTDMLDGCYAEWLTLGMLRLTKQAAVSGLKTNIVGFSINTWQNKNCINALGSLPKKVKFCVRDNVSKDRLQLLLPNRDLTLTADMAFLLEPKQESQIINELETWILNQKRSNKLVIGINISPQLFNDEQKTNEFISLFYKTLLRIEKNQDRDFAFVFISHDLRENNSDLNILTSLYNKCKQDLSAEIFLIDKRIMAREIKYIAGMLDLVITGRMHLSIASLGQETPIGCMVYQGKFEGLFNHFNLPDTYLLDPNEAFKGEELLDFITLIINDRVKIKTIINNNLKHVKQLSKENLVS